MGKVGLIHPTFMVSDVQMSSCDSISKIYEGIGHSVNVSNKRNASLVQTQYNEKSASHPETAREDSNMNSPTAASDTSCFSRNGSDLSELAPLISSMHIRHKQADATRWMGTTIAYLRPSKPEKHEYQSISNNNEAHQSAHPHSGNHDHDEFSSLLEFGPSLTEEVFSKLDNAQGITRHHTGAIPKNLKAVVGSLSRAKIQSRLGNKKWATVKPIKAAKERTFESAIAMANSLASKSMYDLDRRSDEFCDQSP